MRNVEICAVCPTMKLFADAQESRFQAAKRSEMCSAVKKDLDLLILRNRVLRLENVTYGLFRLAIWSI